MVRESSLLKRKNDTLNSLNLWLHSISRANYNTVILTRGLLRVFPRARICDAWVYHYAVTVGKAAEG